MLVSPVRLLQSHDSLQTALLLQRTKRSCQRPFGQLNAQTYKQRQPAHYPRTCASPAPTTARRTSSRPRIHQLRERLLVQKVLPATRGALVVGYSATGRKGRGASGSAPVPDPRPGSPAEASTSGMPSAPASRKRKGGTPEARTRAPAAAVLAPEPDPACERSPGNAGPLLEADVTPGTPPQRHVGASKPNTTSGAVRVPEVGTVDEGSAAGETPRRRQPRSRQEPKLTGRTADGGPYSRQATAGGPNGDPAAGSGQFARLFENDHLAVSEPPAASQSYVVGEARAAPAAVSQSTQADVSGQHLGRGGGTLRRPRGTDAMARTDRVVAGAGPSASTDRVVARPGPSASTDRAATGPGPSAVAAPPVFVFWDLDNKYPETLDHRALVGRMRASLHEYGRVAEIRAYANFQTLNFVPEVWQEALALGAEHPVADRELRCPVCGRKFQDRSKLDRHFKELHRREHEKRLSHAPLAKQYVQTDSFSRFGAAARQMQGRKRGYDLEGILASLDVKVRAVPMGPQRADVVLQREAVELIQATSESLPAAPAGPGPVLALVSDDHGFEALLKLAATAGWTTVVLSNTNFKNAGARVAWSGVARSR